MPIDAFHVHPPFHSIIHLYWYVNASFSPDLCFLMIDNFSSEHSTYFRSCFFRMAQLFCFPLSVFPFHPLFPFSQGVILQTSIWTWTAAKGEAEIRGKSEPFRNRTWTDFCRSWCLTVLCSAITWRWKASNAQVVKRLRVTAFKLSPPDRVQTCQVSLLLAGKTSRSVVALVQISWVAPSNSPPFPKTAKQLLTPFLVCEWLHIMHFHLSGPVAHEDVPAICTYSAYGDVLHWSYKICKSALLSPYLPLGGNASTSQALG